MTGRERSHRREFLRATAQVVAKSLIVLGVAAAIAVFMTYDHNRRPSGVAQS
jgi:FtsH-binding integral membrane protein